MSVSCAICMSSYDEDLENELVSLRCGHVYHKNCLTEWKNCSKQMSCPECRQKYTNRTLTKLYLNILPKDEGEGEPSNGEVYSELQKDKERLLSDLLKSRDEYQKLMEKNSQLDQMYNAKCQTYTLVDELNNEYLTANKILKEEISQLKTQNTNLKDELDKIKMEKIRSSLKPFVDLTHDDISDDSDIEIIEDEKKAEDAPVVEVKEDEVIELQPVANSYMGQADKVLPSIFNNEENFFKTPYNSNSGYVDDSFNNYNFILDQI